MDIEKITLEIRPRLGICQVFVNFKTSPPPFSIKICRDSIEFHTGDIPFVFRLTHCKLKPISLVSFRAWTNFLSFRINIESLSPPVIPSPELETTFVQTNRDYRLICRCCRNFVTNRVYNFSSIGLEPSRDAEMDDVFCHGNSLPERKAEIIYGICSFSIVGNGRKGVFRCPRCLSWLGTSQEDRMILWNHTVFFESRENPNLNSYFTDEFQEFSHFLKRVLTDSLEFNLLNDAADRTVRFVCHLTDEKRVCLILRVMDKRLLLLESESKESCCKNVLKPSYSMKVLFKSVNDDEEKIKESTCFQISQGMYEASLKALTASNRMLPSDWAVGYDGSFIAYLHL